MSDTWIGLGHGLPYCSATQWLSEVSLPMLLRMDLLLGELHLLPVVPVSGISLLFQPHAVLYQDQTVSQFCPLQFHY